LSAVLPGTWWESNSESLARKASALTTTPLPHYLILIHTLINKKSKNLLISCCYRPPAGKTEYFCNFLQNNILEKNNLDKKRNYLIGDFNLNCFDYYENENIKTFYNNLFEMGTIPIINRPTRITNSSSSLIDNILTTDFFNKSLKKGIIKTDVSDDFPIFFSISIDSKRVNNEKIEIKKRIYNNKNLISFKEQLSLIDWNHINFDSDINIIYSTFLKTFYEVYDVNFLLRKIILKTKDILSPWISKGLKKSSKMKQKLYVKYLKSKSEKHKINYQTYKNLYEKLCKNAKKNTTLTCLTNTNMIQSAYGK